MKPYMMNYSQTVKLQPAASRDLDTTLTTKSLEPVDPDEMLLSTHTTFITDSVEATDPDEIVM